MKTTKEEPLPELTEDTLRLARAFHDARAALIDHALDHSPSFDSSNIVGMMVHLAWETLEDTCSQQTEPLLSEGQRSFMVAKAIELIATLDTTAGPVIRRAKERRAPIKVEIHINELKLSKEPN